MDLFEKEQQFYDMAFTHIIDVRNGASFNFEEFETITKEYGKLLKHVRRITKLADKTTIDLFESNIDLNNKVHRDTLTGIYNRRYLEEKVHQLIIDLSRSNSSLGIMMLDIDFFKKYNDTYGHSQGDECLKIIAKTLNNAILRRGDFVARYGGEEFAVILTGTDESGACIMAEKMLKNIRDLEIPNEKNNDSGIVTVSIGVTTSDFSKTQNWNEYVEKADKALYLSKNNGRNRYTFLAFE